ncbi:hypothetical protein [Pseudoalteromonas piscicida]|uniref:hypothetical protein n=1 Tax=Pseudoalteromonas piscicida TaxID=43662 RepID=UPI0032C16931
MMDCTNHKEKLEEIKELFAEAEAICKKVEAESSKGPVIPSINQLRYAGQHLLAAIVSDSSSVQKDELRKAENHCQRAIYDAAEAGCLTAKELIEGFKSDFKKVSIVETVTSYRDTLKALTQLKRIIGEKRADVSKQDHYRELADLFMVLYDGLIDLEGHEEELKKALSDKEREQEISERALDNSDTTVKQNNVRIILVIFGFILSAVSGYYFGTNNESVDENLEPPQASSGSVPQKQQPPSASSAQSATLPPGDGSGK